MQKLILCCCLFASIFSNTHAQWVNITPLGVQSINNISVINDKQAVVLSNDSLPFLYYTNDGGMSWVTKNLPIWLDSDPMRIRSIQFLDAQHGFAYGDWLVNGGVYQGGTESFALYSTNDGGDTWTLLLPEIPTVGFINLNSLHFFNTLQGVYTAITGLGYALIKTTDDGGLTWQTRDTISSWDQSSHFKQDGLGYSVRYNYYSKTYLLYKVTDFGKTWTSLGVAGTDANWPEQRKGLWFDQHLYINDLLVFRSRADLQNLGADDDLYYIDQSVDGGANWQEDFFESPIAPIQNLVVENEVVWLHTYRDLYRRDLSVRTQDADAKALVFKAFPNPAKSASKVQISTLSQLEGAIDIQLFSVNGQLVSTQKSYLQAGNVTVALPVLSAGSYEMRVVLGGEVLGSTFVLVQ
jgi:photosystem II stability/assembly factor-like uncharacterized protein